jgi:hypothetical protein
MTYLCLVYCAAFPPGYGALIGLAATGGAFGLTMLYNKVFPPQRTSRFIGVLRTQRVSAILIYSTTNYIREFFTFLCRRERDNRIPPSALMKCYISINLQSPTCLNMPVLNVVWWAKVRHFGLDMCSRLVGFKGGPSLIGLNCAVSTSIQDILFVCKA